MRVGIDFNLLRRTQIQFGSRQGLECVVGHFFAKIGTRTQILAMTAYTFTSAIAVTVFEKA